MLYKRIFISLGSNLGNREAFLEKAVDGLKQNDGIRILRKSSVLENSAILYVNQPDFLNQILEIEAHYSPLELLQILKEIEAKTGRKERFRYGPREIDLDILSFGGMDFYSDELTIPHPGLFEREYLTALLEELGETPATAAGKLKATEIIL